MTVLQTTTFCTFFEGALLILSVPLTIPGYLRPECVDCSVWAEWTQAQGSSVFEDTYNLSDLVT